MHAWALLLLYWAGATSGTTTLDQIAGEYEGIRPSIDTAETWKLSIHSNGTYRSVLTERRVTTPPARSIAHDGPVKVEAGRVTLEWTLNPETWGSLLDKLPPIPRTFTERFTPVRWGRRLYLVEDSQADWFIRDVIRGDEPRSSSDGIHLLRVGDWKLRVSGRPEVPEDWKKKFPPDNFRTRVARQLAYHKAEIDAGSRDGLAVGMLLTLYSSKYGATDLRVVSVTAGTALIENDYGDPPLTKGTRVYSRIPDTVEARGR